MKKMATCLALLCAPQALATTPGGDFTGTLSTKTYEDYINVGGTNLTCELSGGSTGYVPVDWAYATLQVEATWDQSQIMRHPAATVYSTSGTSNPAALCNAVDIVKRQADSGGWLQVEKTSTVEVRLQQSYGQGCVRAMIETIAFKLSEDLVLTNVEYRILSGEYADTDCR